MTNKLSPLGYRPGLDGVRGLAVGSVLLWHSSLVPVAAFGTLGVTIFFVLSGFLITRLLLEEREATGGIRLRHFYARRAARLLPALFLMLTVTLLFRPDQWWSAAIGATYVGNWPLAFGLDTGMYGFTWTLAIEEQFYLLWPALLLLSVVRPAWIVAAFVVLMAIRQVPQSQAFAGFSTLTHAPSLLMGAWLAYTPRDLPHVRPMRIVLASLATAAAYLLAIGVGISVEQQVFALLGVVLVIAGYHGRFAWLAPFGRISYGVYLWHLPVLVILRSEPGPNASPVVGVVGCLLAIGIAAGSYHWFELPIQRWARRRMSSGRKAVALGASAQT